MNRWIPLVFALVALLAACGGDGGEATSSSAGGLHLRGGLHHHDRSRHLDRPGRRRQQHRGAPSPRTTSASPPPMA